MEEARSRFPFMGLILGKRVVYYYRALFLDFLSPNSHVRYEKYIDEDGLCEDYHLEVNLGYYFRNFPEASWRSHVELLKRFPVLQLRAYIVHRTADLQTHATLLVKGRDMKRVEQGFKAMGEKLKNYDVARADAILDAILAEKRPSREDHKWINQLYEQLIRSVLFSKGIVRERNSAVVMMYPTFTPEKDLLHPVLDYLEKKEDPETSLRELQKTYKQCLTDVVVDGIQVTITKQGHDRFPFEFIYPLGLPLDPEEQLKWHLFGLPSQSYLVSEGLLLTDKEAWTGSLFGFMTLENDTLPRPAFYTLYGKSTMIVAVPGLTCNYCHRLGHRTSTCPKIRCHKCNTIGHMSKMCRKEKRPLEVLEVPATPEGSPQSRQRSQRSPTQTETRIESQSQGNRYTRGGTQRIQPRRSSRLNPDTSEIVNCESDSISETESLSLEQD